MMYTFTFTARDNGGKFHCYKVKAKDKADAIRKGLDKARKNAKGDLNPNWQCKLNYGGR